MKKFIAILMVLLMIPLYCFAANSPTIEKVVTCNPAIQFAFAEKTAGWETLLARLEDIKEETDGYILLEALEVTLDKEYEKVEWNLPIEILTEHEPFALIVDPEAIVKQELSTTETGGVIVDFTEYEPGVYYICFYIKALE